MVVNAKLLTIVPHTCIIRLCNYHLYFISTVSILGEDFFQQRKKNNHHFVQWFQVILQYFKDEFSALYCLSLIMP